MAKGREKSTPPIEALPDEWNCVLKKAFAHVTKFFGGDYEASLHAIKQALVSGRIAAMVRPLADFSNGYVLSVEFWQPPRLSSVGLGDITVLSKEYPPNVYRFFLRQSDLEKVWPVSGGSGATTAPATSPKERLKPQVAACIVGDP